MGKWGRGQAAGLWTAHQNQYILNLSSGLGWKFLLLSSVDLQHLWGQLGILKSVTRECQPEGAPVELLHWFGTQ